MISNCIGFLQGGNRNNFETKEECDEICVHPEGKRVFANIQPLLLIKKLVCLTIFDKACNLPMVPGPCEGSYFHYGYNPERGICEQFKYGGCLGELLLMKLQMHYWVAPQETTTSSKQSRSATKCALKTTSNWCWQTNASSPSNRGHGEIYISQSLFVSMLLKIYQPFFCHCSFLVRGISLAMDMTKRLRLVKSSTMVDVKVVLISKNTIFKKTFPF